MIDYQATKRIFFYYLLALFLALICLRCSPEPALFELEKRANLEIFTIYPGVDTVLRSTDGVEIFISKSSFKNPPEQLSLSIRTVLGTYEMLMEGCITMTRDGRLLESDGMLFIETKPSVAIDPNFPIRVRIPQKRPASNMKVFKGDTHEGSIYWEESGDLNQNESLEAIDRGEEMFSQNCVVCHGTDMRKGASGPPLGNVTLFREYSFLQRFTRNSPKLIFVEKDSLAICIYEYNQKGAMNPFPNFSDKEIFDIYAYIDSESRNQQIGLKEIAYPTSCSKDSNRTVFYNAVGEVIDTLIQEAASPFTPVFLPIPLVMDTIEKPVGFYEFSVFSFGWYNVDMFRGSEEGEIDNFRIEIVGQEPRNVKAYLVFKDRAVTIPLEYEEGYYYLLYGAEKERIQFPENEPLILVAFAGLEDDFAQFGQLAIVSHKTDNNYTLKMKPTHSDEIKRILQAIN